MVNPKDDGKDDDEGPTPEKPFMEDIFDADGLSGADEDDIDVFLPAPADEEKEDK